MKIRTAAAAAAVSSLFGLNAEGLNIPMRPEASLLSSDGSSSSTASSILSEDARPPAFGGALPPRVVGAETERRRVEAPHLRDRLRRRGTTRAALDNQETLYFVNMSLGTPAQRLRLHLDTGSSDLWVNTPGSSLCRGRSAPCGYAGTYTANSSSTYQYVASNFNISYVDGSGAGGDYVTDVATLGSGSNAKLSRLQFGIGYTSSSSQSILGIGYELNEVQVNRAGGKTYRNLPTQMVADGLIASPTYSLWLNDLSASKGSILFGGVDTEQFSGSLHTLPIQQNGGAFREFLITMTSVSAGSTMAGENMAQAVLLDSGSSLTYLPDSVTQNIYNAVGAQYDSSQGAAYVPCSLANSRTNPSTASMNLTFTFSSPASISVGMDELVLDLTTSSGRRPTFSNGVPACLFGIAPSGSGTAVLGDTFLRSAYVVYDMANNAISIAQTRFNATRSNIVEVSSGSTSVPHATPVSNPVAATAGLQLSHGIGAAAAPGGGSKAALFLACALAGLASAAIAIA